MSGVDVVLTEGWGWPAFSKKAHYFLDGRSLCMKWLFGGPLESGNDNSDDNCAACKRAVAKRGGSK